MQVVILHKEIGLKIAEFVHYAKCRAQRALGARKRAANKKMWRITPPRSMQDTDHARCRNCSS